MTSSHLYSDHTVRLGFLTRFTLSQDSKARCPIWRDHRFPPWLNLWMICHIATFTPESCETLVEERIKLQLEWLCEQDLHYSLMPCWCQWKEQSSFHHQRCRTGSMGSKTSLYQIYSSIQKTTNYQKLLSLIWLLVNSGNKVRLKKNDQRCCPGACQRESYIVKERHQPALALVWRVWILNYEQWRWKSMSTKPIYSSSRLSDGEGLSLMLKIMRQGSSCLGE